jgi:hypothetical protein
MQEDVVKFWNSAKGCGFLTTGDGVDYFCHATAVERSDAIPSTVRRRRVLRRWQSRAVRKQS